MNPFWSTETGKGAGKERAAFLLASVWVRALGTEWEVGRMKLLFLHQALVCWVDRVQC